jgi:hypothetical protein
MATYLLEAHLGPLPGPGQGLDAHTMERLWQLFVAIGSCWGNNDEPQAMRSNFQGFLDNRIRIDPGYAGEYRNAAEVIDELALELGEEGAFVRLLTDPLANLSPPATRRARARQRVSNELVALQLSLGGFKAFGAENYLGYIGGPNIEGRTPYRVYKPRNRS